MINVFRKPKNTFTSDKATYGIIWDPIHEAIDIVEINLKRQIKNFILIKRANNAQFTKILRQKDLIKMDYY